MTFPLVGQRTIGVRTFFGTWVAPGARVTYLGPPGVYEDIFSENNRVPTLNAALARCRSGKGDFVFALPGYTEDISAADFASSLVAGTNLVGLAPFGSTQMPTFNFSLAAATILLDVADVTLSGFRFTNSADAIANYLVATAAGCAVRDCVFNLGAAAALDVTLAIHVNASGASDLAISGNRFFSTGTAVCTNAIRVNAAVAGLRIENNDFDVQASAATDGVIEFTTGANQFRVSKNNIVNRRAAAAVAIRWADVATLNGIISDNTLAFTADITASTAALSAAGTANHLVRAFNNLVHDENQGTAIPALMTSAAAIE